MSIHVQGDTNESITINVQSEHIDNTVNVRSQSAPVNAIGTTPLFGPQGPKGDKGDKGDNGQDAYVVSIEPIEQSGYDITYQMTFNDGQTYNFTVTNGTGSLKWLHLEFANWVQEGSLYKYVYSGSYSVINVYKGNVNNRDLVTNADVNVQGSITTIYCPDAFEGYALVADITNSEAAQAYEHTQAVSSNTWVINHNLNTQPSVIVMDSSGRVFEPDEIVYNSLNTVTLSFIANFSGKAVLNYTR